MARKKRDYKAEYAAAKRRATQAGYKSEREYKTARKTLGVPRNASPIPKRLYTQSTSYKRVQSKAWSKAHSNRHTSSYRDIMTDDQVDRYWAAYVEDFDESGKAGKREKQRRIHDYLVPDILTETEWKGTYPV